LVHQEAANALSAAAGRRRCGLALLARLGDRDEDRRIGAASADGLAAVMVRGGHGI
jgi:hypothetical protein